MIQLIDQRIKLHFGSKQGLVKFFAHQGLTMLGFYREEENIALESITRLVFICDGNICRSPLAEAVAKAAGIPSISFGLSCTDNHPADPRACAFAASQQLDLSAHKTTNIARYTPQPGDLLVGMAPQHTQALGRLFDRAAPIALLGLWHSPAIAYLHDPYNTPIDYFNHCSHRVAAATRQLIAELKKHHDNTVRSE